MQTMNKVIIGEIIAPHGVRGDLRIKPLTDNTELFSSTDYLLLPDGKKLTVLHAAPHKNIMLVKTREVTSMDAAEELRGLKVAIKKEDLPELPEDTYYIGDLVGLEVVDEAGKKIGILKDVLRTGSVDVYVIADEDGKENLVAAISENVRSIDMQAGKITVRMPEYYEGDE